MNASPALPLPVAPRPPAATALPPLAWFNLGVLAVLLLGLIRLLWPHWRENPDLSHGYVTPVIFLLLLWEARGGTPRYLTPGGWIRLAQAVCVMLGVGLVFASGLYAAAVDWTHSLVAFVLTGACAALLMAALLSFASTGLRLLPCNWTALVAIGVWILSAPIPPGTYVRIMLALQLAVTENVLRALHLLGIAAQRHGNVIQLATTSVGVEEACSGIRSLVSCIFAALFFSATLVRRPWARAVIIGLAAPLAILMNFVRSLVLTLLANAGVDISGRWHDYTGFAVLGITAAVLAALALLLERVGADRERRSANTRAAATEPASGGVFPGVADAASTTGRRDPVRGQRLLAGAGVLTLGLAVFFLVNTRPSARQGLPPPDLLAILPAASEGWHVQTSQDLYQFSATLKTEHLAQRTYARVRDGVLEQVIVYLAYWPAGQAPVSLVASHTPDACWPGSGWEPVPLRPPGALTLPERTLPAAESRLFVSNQRPQYVWFWHLYDGRPISHREPRSPMALLEIAWNYGFSHDGDQLFVRVSSNRPWPALAEEPLLRELFAQLQPYGL